MNTATTIALLLFIVLPYINVTGREIVARTRAQKPPSNCYGANPEDKVTDPEDCTKFFVCFDDGIMSPESSSCHDLNPTYLCFDPVTMDCSYNSRACADACVPRNSSVCQTECTGNLEQIADMNDCGRHSLCLGQGPDFIIVQQHCPSDAPWFDGTRCTTDKSECCNCRLDECVENEGNFIADPQDCHSYFFCERVGLDVYPVGPYLCEDGGSFIDGSCDKTSTECDTICDLDKVENSSPWLALLASIWSE